MALRLWPAEFNYSGCDHRGLLCKGTILTTAIPAWRRLERSDPAVTRVGVDLGSRMDSWLSSPQAGERAVLEPRPMALCTVAG